MLAAWCGIGTLWGTLGSSATAYAAEVTDLAPPLGAFASIQWDGSQVVGGLVETSASGAQSDVGERRLYRQNLLFGAELSPVEGFAFTFDLAASPVARFSYPAARTMVVDPLSGLGVYHETDPGPDVTLNAGGFGGVWVGVAGAPSSERYALGQRVSTRLDLAVRTPRPNQNLWTTAGGTRSPAPGGWGMRLAGAFSTERGLTNPYMRGEYVHEFPKLVDVVTEDGVTWATDLKVRPARTFEASAGMELAALERSDGTRVAADGWLGAGYRTWEDVASGVYLPNVLDTGRLVPVTATDTIIARAGLGANVHIQDLVRVRAGATLGWFVPYRLEHLYQVQTSPDTTAVGWFVEVTGVARVPTRAADPAPPPTLPAPE